ncbi:MAG: hypothetical protein JOZ75_08715 [Candidatus Dormibacteraeota bacterium]|nr:hypothetical protein [Candidatus Dormibacteraeota bacterium]
MIWILLVVAAIGVAITWVLWKGTSGRPNTGAEMDNYVAMWDPPPLVTHDHDQKPPSV